MPILSSIQRRSLGGKILLATMYTLLVIGAVWMVYPFLLMLSGSVKSDVDIRRFDVIPQYLRDDAMLFRKFEEQRYNGSLALFNSVTRYKSADGHTLASFEHLEPPTMPSAAVLADWNEFVKQRDTLPRYYFTLGHAFTGRGVAEVTLQFQNRLWNSPTFSHLPRHELDVRLLSESWVARSYQSLQEPFGPLYNQMRTELPSRYFFPTSVEGQFALQFLPARYGTTDDGIKKLNEKWGTHYESYQDIRMTGTEPPRPVRSFKEGPSLTAYGEERQYHLEDWWSFVRKSLSARFINFDASLLPAYREFLQKKYQDDLPVFNKVYGTQHTKWDEVTFPQTGAAVVAFSDLENFLQARTVPDGITLDSVEFRWRSFLRKKYATLEELNQAHAANLPSFDAAPMPTLAHDWQLMQESKGAITWDYVSRNYKVVWNFLAGRGNALKNTIILCVLAVFTALIVNPLAAYALSRFQPRWGYKVLFFLMATMAFPGEVTAIPNFLMLRDLGWLNTFFALVIPGMASGYSIFLLKGFFDSLPKDLYESATLDGASELRIFTTITIPLSAPILAVIALGAFTGAYGAFLFALLVCQKESMWTLMVYIYQLQQIYNIPIIFAALVLAAVPTLLVFVFCQKIIMRGIVVPVEK